MLFDFIFLKKKICQFLIIILKFNQKKIWGIIPNLNAFSLLNI